MKLADSIQLELIKPFVYGELINYYKKINDTVSYIEYSEKLKNSQKKQHSSLPKTLNSVTTKLRLESEENKNRNTSNIIFSIIAISLLLGLLSWLNWNHNKNKKRYIKLIKKLRESEIKKNKSQNINLSRSDSNKQPLISLETEKLLLHKINKFEGSQSFLDKNMSLPVLAGMFGTNTKYLSYVINTHKRKDFTNYINELRIFYIVEELKKNPSYRNYKISYLAEISGFSSHAKFATIFKNVTGISPSTFISFLSKEEEKA